MRGFSPLFLTLRAVLAVVAFIFLWGSAAQAANPAVETVRVQTHPGFTRIVLETNAPIEPNLFTLPGPNRLVIDLPEVQWKIPRPTGTVDSQLVRKYSFGLFQPGVSRLVLDLSAPAQVIGRKLSRSGRFFVYEIDLANIPPAMDRLQPASESVVAPTSLPQAVRFPLDDLPIASVVDPATKDVFSGRSFDPEKAEFSALSDVIAAALADTGSGPTLTKVETADHIPDLAPERTEPQTDAASDEVGDEIEAMQPERPKRPPLRIVLDPGHGGKDPGTGSGVGVKEKDINLAFAAQLKELLEADQDYVVFLTRETDTRVALPKRVSFARRKNADLFISIHADWSDNVHAKGATAYTLSEKASVEALESIASDKDSVGRVAGVDLAAEREDVARLLVDLARRETQARSLKFAELVIAEVAKETPVLRRPLRRNSFHVLKAPDMPSVLLELGFLSNETDSLQLQSPTWRLKTSEAVKRAIDGWRRATGSRDFAIR